MIKLFVSDLDGCLAHPFQSPDWGTVTRIKELNRLSASDPAVPPFTILSGRPLPFVEAIGQWLEVDVPMIFESGGGMYAFRNNELRWNPHFDEEARASIIEIKEWMDENLVQKFDKTIAEFTKFTDAGLINPNHEKIKLMHKELLNYISENYPRFEVHDTEISINVILKMANKGEGLKFLCNRMNLTPEEVAYIGDSSGDIPALKIAGRSFAPLNATSHAKETAGLVVSEATLGVLEAYERVIELNRSSKSTEQ